MNYGFVRPKIEGKHYVLGGVFSLPKSVLQADGQWDKWLPDREFQNMNGVEVYNCTSFGTLNCIETLVKKLYNK